MPSHAATSLSQARLICRDPASGRHSASRQVRAEGGEWARDRCSRGEAGEHPGLPLAQRPGALKACRGRATQILRRAFVGPGHNVSLLSTQPSCQCRFWNYSKIERQRKLRRNSEVPVQHRVWEAPVPPAPGGLPFSSCPGGSPCLDAAAGVALCMSELLTSPNEDLHP